jgi:hypothetical protein
MHSKQTYLEAFERINFKLIERQFQRWQFIIQIKTIRGVSTIFNLLLELASFRLDGEHVCSVRLDWI